MAELQGSLQLDVHKRSWNAAIFLGDHYLRNIHQPPSPHALHHYLNGNYPGAHYICAYEVENSDSGYNATFNNSEYNVWS